MDSAVVGFFKRWICYLLVCVFPMVLPSCLVSLLAVGSALSAIFLPTDIVIHVSLNRCGRLIRCVFSFSSLSSKNENSIRN